MKMRGFGPFNIDTEDTTMTSSKNDDDLGEMAGKAHAEIQQQYADSERSSVQSQGGAEGSLKKILAVVLCLAFVAVFVWQLPRFSEPFSHLVPASDIDIAQADLTMLGDSVRRFQVVSNRLPTSLEELEAPLNEGTILPLRSVEYRPSGNEFRLSATLGNQRLEYASETGMTSVSN